MSSNLSNTTAISTTGPSLQGQARVDLVKNDFDAVVWQKGYEVLVERAMKCPCRNEPNASGLPSCRNCGGNGWLFYNKTSTRMVLQSMNLDTKYKEWSEERMGTVKITALTELDLGYHDKITLVNAQVIDSQVLFVKDYNEGLGTPDLRTKTVHDILEVKDLFLLVDPKEPLVRLNQGSDFTIDATHKNVIKFDAKYVDRENMTVSIRYKYNPSFYVLEFMRELMSTQQVDKATGQDVVKQLPIHAMARRTHYVLNEENSTGTYLHDNSYASACAIKTGLPNVPSAPRVVTQAVGSITIGWDDPSTAETNFIIQRKIGVGGAYQQVAIVAANTTSHIDTNVTATNQYFYRIATVENGKQSPWSGEIGVVAV